MPAPPAAAAPATATDTTLTGAVVPVADARITPPPQPPPRRSAPTIPPAPVAPADNVPAVDTHAAGGPALKREQPAPHLARRRRRSASALPPLPSPADIPDDAPGRVTFLIAGDAPDVVPDGGVPAAGQLPASTPDMPRPQPANPFDEWRPVILLAAAMLIVFIVGLVLTH